MSNTMPEWVKKQQQLLTMLIDNVAAYKEIAKEHNLPLEDAAVLPVHTSFVLQGLQGLWEHSGRCETMLKSGDILNIVKSTLIVDDGSIKLETRLVASTLLYLLFTDESVNKELLESPEGRIVVSKLLVDKMEKTSKALSDVGYAVYPSWTNVYRKSLGMELLESPEESQDKKDDAGETDNQ